MNAFLPQGNTQLIIATTAPSITQVSAGGINGARITADGPVYMSLAQSSAASATAPTTAVAAGMPLMFNSTGVRVAENFTFGPNAWLSFTTTSGTANVWLTPGVGS